MRPKVSIIVPIYNVEPWLAQCMESIRNQTVKEIEIILIDDGSPDGCPEMCDRFAAEDERIRVIHQENAGASAARNRGMEAAVGDWLIFVDPDDWLEYNAVELLYKYAETDEYDIVYAPFFWNYPDKQVEGKFPASQEGEHFVEQEYLFIFETLLAYRTDIAPIYMAGPCSKLYKRDMVIDNQCCFPEGMKIWEDIIFNLYVTKSSKKIYVSNIPVYHYRQRQGSACHGPHGEQQESTERLQHEVRQFMERNSLLREFQIYYDFIVIRSVLKYFKNYGKNIKSLRDVHTVPPTLKALVQEPENLAAIQNTSIMFMPKRKEKIALWMLKHAMYRTIIAYYYLKNKLGHKEQEF